MQEGSVELKKNEGGLGEGDIRDYCVRKNLRGRVSKNKTVVREGI